MATVDNKTYMTQVTELPEVGFNETFTFSGYTCQDGVCMWADHHVLVKRTDLGVYLEIVANEYTPQSITRYIHIKFPDNDKKEKAYDDN